MQSYKKYFLFLVWVTVFLFFAKLGADSSISLWVVLPPITLAVVCLTLLSPPVATAMVFMGHNLIGQISMSHPGVLVQVFPAGVLILSLLYVRRKEFSGGRIHWKAMRPETWGVIAIVAIFVIGFIYGILAQVDTASFKMVANLFKASHGGSREYYPYVFMSRWGVFITIGALCCRGADELKTFFLAISVFVTTQLMAVPFDMYQWVLSDMCFNRLNYTGLQALNVNRAYLGYLLASASFIMLAFAVYESKRAIAFLYYLVASIFLFLCIIAGSKGPVAAISLAMLFLFIRGGRKMMFKLAAYGLSFAILSAVLPRLYGCDGGLQSIFKSSITTTQSSISVRTDLAKAEFKKTEESHNLFGGGLGSSLALTESTFLDPITNKPRIIMSSSGSHNLFLDLYVDLGAIGLSIFLLGLSVLVFFFFKNTHQEMEGHLLATLMGGVLLILLVYSALATAPSMATIQALFLGILFGVGIKSKVVLN